MPHGTLLQDVCSVISLAVNKATPLESLQRGTRLGLHVHILASEHEVCGDQASSLVSFLSHHPSRGFVVAIAVVLSQDLSWA